MSKTATNIIIVGWIVIVGLSFVVAAETNDIGGVLIMGFGSLFWLIVVQAASEIINWPLVVETYHRRKREPLLRIIRHALVAMAFIAVLALIGEMGYQDALLEQELYAELVCNGTYPDYKNINPECN